MNSAELQPVTIPVNDAQRVSGLLQAPQEARACCVLAHGAGHHYDGILHVPAGTKAGTYRFYYIATQENCIENKTFPHQDVHL